MSITHDVARLADMKASGAFKNYIDYIRFPRFRNLEPDSKIDFHYPVTAFVGQNGCSKSSTLQALFGCPKGKSVGTYWFNTALDPIQELNPEDRHCIIYSYHGLGAGGEVLKTRINKAGQLDLWDTSEGIARYGMTPGKRIAPVEKNVVYINFRVVQNAFERRFHSQRPPQQGIQELMRYKTGHLRQALGGQSRFGRYRYETHNPPVDLSSDAVSAISSILGRKYLSARVIYHRFFGYWGHSVILQTQHATYTEAFAGSGEFAVALLVHELISAPKETLLLLDEPETSLHPAAQRGLLEFVLGETIGRRHQTVICTHAPALIEALPETAVKVFALTANGRFGIYQNIFPSEAFFYLGQPLANRLMIRVEDRLAQAAVQKCLEHLGQPIANLFDVRFYPGGVDTMKRDAAIYAREGSTVVLLLDGDQKCKEVIEGIEYYVEPFDPGKLTVEQFDDPAAAIDVLDGHIRKITGTRIAFSSDGGTGGGNREQQRDARIQYLNFYRTRVEYLPAATAEELIWNESVAENALQMFAPEVCDTVIARIRSEENIKTKFDMLTDAISISHDASDIEVVHRIFLKRWISDDSVSFKALKEVLLKLKQLVPA